MALTVDDLRDPLFDRQRVVRRQVPARPGTASEDEDGLEDLEAFERGGEPRQRKEEAIEGTTFTDDFNEVGFTYYPSDGLLRVVNTGNVELFKGVIATREDFEKALKRADRKQRRLRR